MRKRVLVAAGAVVCGGALLAQSAGWYTQGDFVPSRRLVVELTNELDIDRVDVPVVIRRDQVPATDLHELEVTVVDPALPPGPPPGAERLKRGGGHELLGEANGHILQYVRKTAREYESPVRARFVADEKR